MIEVYAHGMEAAETVGVIDIGSNSVRMVVAQVHPNGETEVLEQMRQPVRLGHTFLTGRLSQPTIRAVLRVLRDYRKVLDSYQVDRVRAVATYAVREASNRDAFLDRIGRAVGIDAKVIEPTEQSRLIVLAVRNVVVDLQNSRHRPTMIAEVGGGGTLLTILRRGEIVASQSYSLGAVRMRELLSSGGHTPEKAAKLLYQQVGNSIKQVCKTLPLKSVNTFLAIGGDARFAAEKIGRPTKSAEIQIVERRDLDRLIKACIPLGPAEIASTYQLAFSDAETLVPALLVYQALLGATGARAMMVSKVSMRDGLLLDLPRYVAGREDLELSRSIIASAKTIAARYRYDDKHAEHVAAIAVRLFDNLQNEHGLTQRHRLLLKVAALMHEIGKFVATRAHHKHSYYLIANAEILGLSRNEINMVAQVARYHRRSIPKTSHLEYAALPRDQRMVVNKLAAILRVADSLDKGHWQQLREFHFEQDRQELVIYVNGTGDLGLERLAIFQKSDLFEDIFGLKVRLDETPEGQYSRSPRETLSLGVTHK
ncbi:MAG: Ppx/GppA family phosphatase [Phycisphaerae bacterium]|nr:Ppx/GppA family phosphatase [Phycisphaerae bacterium]